MNVWLSRSGDSYLVDKFVIKRLLLAGVDDPTEYPNSLKGASPFPENELLVAPDVSGTVELAHNTLTVFKYGKGALVEENKTGQERFGLLKQSFGITLSNEEAAAILHRLTALQH